MNLGARNRLMSLPDGRHTSKTPHFDELPVWDSGAYICWICHPACQEHSSESWQGWRIFAAAQKMSECYFGLEQWGMPMWLYNDTKCCISGCVVFENWMQDAVMQDTVCNTVESNVETWLMDTKGLFFSAGSNKTSQFSSYKFRVQYIVYKACCQIKRVSSASKYCSSSSQIINLLVR